MSYTQNEWNVYRTRFLIQAKQLTEPLYFVDALGREHWGNPGDYLVESPDGMRRIAPRKIFEDVYVPLAPSPAEMNRETDRGRSPFGKLRAQSASVPQTTLRNRSAS